MLCLVLLSASTVFATDDVADDTIAVNDEITIDETLTIEEDISTVSADESDVSSNVVTKDTFSNYFDENGTLLSTVTSEELTFKGDISDVGVDKIVFNRTIKIIGDDAVISNVVVDIQADDVIISGLTINQNNGTAAIAISNASNVKIEDTTINFNAIANYNGFAIDADLADNLNLINNAVNYLGATTGWEINNGIRVTNSNNVVIKGNKFNLTLVSSAVGWAEVPAGSNNWVSSAISEGIVIDACNNVEFEDNILNANYNDVVGGYDTLYIISVKNSDSVLISANDINALGHTYIYAIQISGKDFNITENNIAVESDNYYANGIDVEGPANGLIDNNVIYVKGNVSAYAIYSGMNNQDVSTVISNNVISGDAYNVFGLSLGDVKSIVENNKLNLNGNYTTGIASHVQNITITGNDIILTSSEEGNESIWESFGIETAGIKVTYGEASINKNNISSSGTGINVTGDKITLSENTVDVSANFDKDAYAIYANEVADLSIDDNIVKYVGNTNLNGINNGMLVFNSSNACINNNKFYLTLVSAYVDWVEEPAGSWNYVPYPVSEGVVVESSNGVVFNNNTIDSTFNNVVGYYDTIYAVHFKNSDDVLIENNTINAVGSYYIYGIQISGNNFKIVNNVIKAISDVYYANGIDIEGPATGVVDNNEISANGLQLAYPIYSGMNGKEVSVNYTNNKLSGEAYFVLGMSLGDVENNIVNNTISLTGNYTTGIASNAQKINITDNIILAQGNNIGNESIWDSFGVETTGIKIINAESIIKNNTVKTTGDYAINLNNNNATVEDNYLASKKGAGNSAVTGASNAAISGSSPELKTIISAPTLYTEYVDGTVFPVVLKDENGDPVVNATIFAVVDGVTYNVTTDDEGYAAFVLDLNAGVYNITLSYDGNETYGPKSYTGLIVVDVSATEIVAPASKSVFLTAVKSGSYVTLTLKDMNDNGLGDKKVSITFNGKTKTYTTSELGVIKFKLSATKVGTYTLKMKFAGDENFVGSDATTKVKITKQATKVTAKAKTFKAKTKTKKYTIVLKDSKKKAIKKVKVTIKVGKKTFKATTNAKGKAVFKITKLTKKGKYTAKVKFAGNKYYKAVTKSVKITVKK